MVREKQSLSATCAGLSYLLHSSSHLFPVQLGVVEAPGTSFSSTEELLAPRRALTWKDHAADEDHMSGVLAIVLELGLHHPRRHSLLKENPQGG